MISFIIPAYNEEKYIGATIESIKKQGSQYVKEIIVADNGSTDRTREVAQSFPGVIVVSETNKGTNFARQKGLMAATAPLIACVDADTLLPENWSAIATSLLNRNSVVGVSGPYHYDDRGVFLYLFTLFFQLLIYVPVHWLFNSIFRNGGIILGGNMICRRDALLKAGGFNTALRFYGDDTDTARRLRTQGKLIFSHRLLAYGSSRRFQKHGFFKTIFLYFLNFFWINVFQKPFSGWGD